MNWPLSIVHIRLIAMFAELCLASASFEILYLHVKWSNFVSVCACVCVYQKRKKKEKKEKRKGCTTHTNGSYYTHIHIVYTRTVNAKRTRNDYEIMSSNITNKTIWTHIHMLYWNWFFVSFASIRWRKRDRIRKYAVEKE